MGIFDDLWEKDIPDEDKQIAYERCKHLSTDLPEEEGELSSRDECIKTQESILYYSKIQLSCIKNGKFIEDDRFVGLEHREWVNCRKYYPSKEEYIEEYGFDPHTECFHCEKDKEGNIIDDREICNPCNPCVSFEYDEDCLKWQYWFLIFDAKACRYWRHPNEEVMWDCEEQAIRAWESDTPPVSKGKIELSFYDESKKKGDFCPKDRHKITGDPEIDKHIPKTPNSFKWCVPRWNDQCRFFIIQFRHQLLEEYDTDTIYTQWKFIKKCNQEECDLAEEEEEGSSFNKLARHAKICISRCYDIDNKYAIYPAWEGNLVNYWHREW